MNVFFTAAGYDHLPVSTTLEFPAGSTKGTKQCINISIVDDLLAEGKEVFNIHATVNSSSVVLFGGALNSSHGTIEVEILDNDGRPALPMQKCETSLMWCMQIVYPLCVEQSNLS